MNAKGTMSKPNYLFNETINLHVVNRISERDAKRQEISAREILSRLNTQPGLILADEVGMGKTFVALAVGISAHLADKEKRPVVVMVPPTITHKWENDFITFRTYCLSGDLQNIQCKVANRTEELLKMFDDPEDRRVAVVFLTHGAMARGLADPWVKLALIKQSLYGRHNTGEVYSSLERYIAEIIELKSHSARLGSDAQEFWNKILNSPFEKWQKIINTYEFYKEPLKDDPVPKPLIDALSAITTRELEDLYKDLRDNLPRRDSSNISVRLTEIRRLLKGHLGRLWEKSITKLQISSPLLIMDEAHHLKNAQTKISKLFSSEEAEQDADRISKGYLANVFDRMLFLTATPFQLGHFELIGVLERFKGINWSTLSNNFSKESYQTALDGLTAALDISQISAIRLERVWGKLTQQDIPSSLETRWWDGSRDLADNHRLFECIETFNECKQSMKTAESILKKWVIRHLRPRQFEFENAPIQRRELITGRGISMTESSEEGLQILEGATLPFLLAARASASSPQTRPVFSEGLASSYEAFLDTRKRRLAKESATDQDDDPIVQENTLVEIGSDSSIGKFNFYIEQIESLLKRKDGFILHGHPKVDATITKAIDLWLRGEKVLIFCHYIESGRALRFNISKKVNEIIISTAAERMGCTNDEAAKKLNAIQDGIDDQKEIIAEITDNIFNSHKEFHSLLNYKSDVVDVIKRMIRTHSFIVRYFPLEKFKKSGKLTKDLLKEAFEKADSSGLSYSKLIESFLKFISQRQDLAGAYIDALKSVQTGSHRGKEILASFSGEDHISTHDEHLNATVRLVNGSTPPESRHKLMLTFNTPFFPEILIASSVMAEGVDLHLNCRHIIHHDLSWNPSTLEQRNGRVDRIGAKVEKCGMPINIYLPYVSATQDEKMFKVVMDRERWFKVIMGDKVKIDSLFETDKLAERVPFPEDAAQELTFKLEIYK